LAFHPIYFAELVSPHLLLLLLLLLVLHPIYCPRHLLLLLLQGWHPSY